MTIDKTTLKMIAANDRRQGKALGVWKYRLASPVLFAALGITLGALTGLAIAILGNPGGASGIPVVLASIDSTVPGYDTAHGATQQVQATAQAEVAGAGKASEGGETLTARTAYRKHHSVRRVARAHKKPALIVTLNASHAGPPPLLQAAEQLELNDESKPSNFYIEGDLQVVGYDAIAGTIETSDGRTFAVGITVAAGNATPWGEYRANLHYRCSQTGRCELSRTGAIAPSARLI